MNIKVILQTPGYVLILTRRGGVKPPHNIHGDFITINTDLPRIPQHLLEYTINPKAFINAHNFETTDELIDEIRRIDSCKQSFEEMLHEPVFLGDFDLHEFYRQRTFDFLCAIIDQGAEKSKRCGQGLYIGQQINAITTTHSLSDKFIGYCGKHQNLIQGIRTISEAPRDFIRRLKHK